MPERSRQAEFWGGAKATLALIVGAAPFGVIFGAVGIASDLAPASVMGMSLIVFAGSAQFIALELIGGGVAYGIIVLTTFVVNLRHALYAASLGPHMKHLPQRWLLPLGFWLTDESYAVVISRYSQADNSPHKHWYFLGSAVVMYSGWQLCTLIGMVAGQQIPDPQGWGLDFAIVVTFIGIIVPLIKDRPVLMAAIVAGGTALLANGLSNRLGLIVAALAGIIAGVVAESVWPPAKGPAPAGERGAL